MALGLGAERVVLFSGAGEDAETAALLRGAGFSADVARDEDDLFRLLEEGAAALIVAEEALAEGGLALRAWLRRQEPWSDLPILLLCNGGPSSGGNSHDPFEGDGNATMLDRPVRPVTLLANVSAALRARRRQLHTRDLLAELAASVRTRDQFLAMLGHELRNPLAAIHTATELLLRSPDGLARHAGVIARQSRKLARLVDDLLEVSRVDSGKVALQRKILDLREVVEHAVEAAMGRAERAGLQLERTLPPGPVLVDGDPVRLEQVLGNLLANAVKYTPTGGEIRVTLERRGAAAAVRVKDTGIGISPELLERIFEPFTQVTTALDRSEGGLGLGLALARGLVSLHGGSVKAQSEGTGRGAELEVVLPLASGADAVAPPGPPDVGIPAATSRRHVLVVEDNADNRDTLVMLLESFGHEVLVASDGPSGVVIGLASHPEVAIVDIGLPGFDGFEVCRRLREALGRSVKLVALTGYGQAEDRERAQAAGFDLHLVKPAEIAELMEAVERPAVERPGLQA